MTLSTTTESHGLRYIRIAETSESEPGSEDKNSVDELVGPISELEQLFAD
jgi:hypothetical protein